MKKFIYTHTATFVLLLFLFTLPVSSAMAFRKLQEGQRPPDIILNDLDGNTFSLAASRGNQVVVLFWRVGQERSHDALKELKEIHKKFAQYSLKVFAITSDTDNLPEILALKKSLDLPFPILLDNKAEAYSSFGVFVIPSTAYIDSKGVYQFHYSGFRDGYMRDISDQVRLSLNLVTKEELGKEHRPKVASISKNKVKALHYINLGKRLMDRSLYEKALKEFESALAMDPDNVEAQIELGNTLLYLKKADQALKLFKSALILNKRSTRAKIGLGRAYRMLGENENALSALGAVIIPCPDSALIHLEMGKIYESIGNKDEALKNYKASAECYIKQTKLNY